jgi:hypothetical protein
MDRKKRPRDPPDRSSRASDDYRVVRDDNFREWHPALFKNGADEIQRVWCLRHGPTRSMRFNFAASSRIYAPNPSNVRWDYKGSTPIWDNPFNARDEDKDMERNELLQQEKKKEEVVKGMDKVIDWAEKEAKNKTVASESLCSVCMDRAICVSFAPCSHMSCCATCTVACLKDKPACPVCRCPVESVTCHFLAGTCTTLSRLDVPDDLSKT